jgi:serine/threonine protein kinase
VILGTAGYMSPEQARGEPIDKRTDIWAFGCVLYEMLTGSAAFAALSTAETLSAVLTNEPAWLRLPPDTQTAWYECYAAAWPRIRSAACPISTMHVSNSTRHGVRHLWTLGSRVERVASGASRG